LVRKLDTEKHTETKIQDILFRPQIGAILYSVLNMKIPQILSAGPKNIDEISQEVHIDKDRLERVLRVLETEKIFNYDYNSR